LSETSHLTEDFFAEPRKVVVDGLVFVEAHADGGGATAEARFGKELADQDSRVCAVVADAPIENGSRVGDVLEKLADLGIVRGIRRSFPGDLAATLDSSFVTGVRTVGKFGLSFEFGLHHWALVFAVELAKRCPDVQFVLNHMALPDIRHAIEEPWRSQIREMGRLPNVIVKISGVIAAAGQGWKASEVKPYVTHAIESFGFDRVMFGSDWPVSKITHPYDAWVDLVADAVRGSSVAEQAALFRGNARRHYRIPLSTVVLESPAA
jgi:L-fuconolactonase